MEKLECPICKETELIDISIRDNNGVFGPGYNSWVVKEMYKCPKCKIVLQP